VVIVIIVLLGSVILVNDFQRAVDVEPKHHD
jgi:hypothetical protein